jgi:rhodanese-related sulfurtransferase
LKSIAVSELRRRLDEGAAPFLLDVREPAEMADGLIAGSVNVPMGEVKERLDELPTDRDIVVICHLGARSAHITKELATLGYHRAVNLDGGMDAWIRETRK